MKPANAAPQTVDSYIASFPSSTQTLLRQLRTAVRSAAPAATEGISYGLVGYKHEGVLLYFGAFKNHIGFYPTGSSLKQFDDELTAYKRSKGTVQFPLNQALPLPLIKRMVAYRVKENEAKAALKQKAKASARQEAKTKTPQKR